MMPRFFPIVLAFLCCGCDFFPVPLSDEEVAAMFGDGSNDALTDVAVDHAAAYPSQEPGTRPPVLTGFLPLTEEQLQEGRLQLFDGVSTFGWDSVNNSQAAKLTVKKLRAGGQPILVSVMREKMEETTNSFHWLPECEFDSIAECLSTSKNADAGRTSVSTTPSFITQQNPGDMTITTKPLSGYTAIQAKPLNMRPLGENDWKAATEPAKSVWTDGVLELTGGSGMVESVAEYGDFVLQLEYKTDGPVNSGVFFRCVPGEKMNGYECQIFNNPPADDYRKYIGTDTGGIFRRCVGRNVGPKDGQWNFLTVAVGGPRVATWVNGIQVVDWTDTRAENENPRNGLRLKPGTIQLQGHDPATKILFRNIRIVESVSPGTPH